MAYQTTRTTLMEMFADNTAGESTFYNRLITRETESGSTALIAYGWLKLAEYSESRNAVTVFTGHAALRSKAVNRWLNKLVDVSEERGRDVIVSGESPTVDMPNDASHYIGEYVGSGKNSSVEQKAVEKVRESLAHLA